MKTLFYFSVGLLACIAEAREQYRVNRYEDLVLSGQAEIVTSKPERRNSWIPAVTLGWPFTTGAWQFKWEGTF